MSAMATFTRLRERLSFVSPISDVFQNLSHISLLPMTSFSLCWFLPH